MRLKAYILAADPAWVEASVLSYYNMVEEIVVSYDVESTSWSGTPINVDECLKRLRCIDKDRKMRFCSGHYARRQFTPIENDTYQRQCALDQLGKDADWLLQLDTDEILPNIGAFVSRLTDKVPAEFDAVDWPMRSFYQQTLSGKLLEVCSLARRQLSSYPGPVAVRPGVQLKLARQTGVRCWRYDIRSHDTDTAAGARPVHRVVPENEAILHLSWVRSEDEMRIKLAGWGHSADFDGQKYLEKIWKQAPRKWRFLYNFHPICPRWWPALRAVDVPRTLLYPHKL